MAFAYKDIPADDFENMKADNKNFQTEADREALENQLTFVGVFALEDPLRDKVLRSI